MKIKVKLFSAVLLMISLITGAVFAVIYFFKQDDKAKIVTSVFPIYDICREIMGNEEDLMLLQDNGADMHSYSPTASDLAVISSAELFIYVGGESDKWVADVLRSIENVNLINLSLMEIQELTKLEEGHDNVLQAHDHEHDHEHEEDVSYDEHIWLSIRNYIIMTETIRDNLIKVFPERQELFKENAEVYIEKLLQLDRDYSQAINNSEGTLIIADRFPFRYLVHDYNLKYFATFSGCSAETEASTETIAKLIDKINTFDVDYILVLETSDRHVAERCLNNSNCKKDVEILVINSCQSITKTNLESSSYLKIMENNLINLKKALGK